MQRIKNFFLKFWNWVKEWFSALWLFIRFKIFMTSVGAWIVFLLVCFGPPTFFIFHLKDIVDRTGKSTHPSIFNFNGLFSYSITSWIAVGLTIISLIYVAINIRQLFRTMTKWIQYIIYPLTIGGATALMLISVYYYFLEKTHVTNPINYELVLAHTLGIYVSICGLFTGFYGVFFDKIPILDIETLMDMMTYDLKECKRRLLWSFPGLSFGSVTIGGKLYDELHDILLEKIEDKKCKATLLVLNRDEIKLFYKPYFEQANIILNESMKRSMVAQINKAIDDSVEMINNAEERMRNPLRTRGSCFIDYVQPNFRHQIIIIDNATYFLQSIGLPIKINNERWIFTTEPQRGSRVSFIATRMNNSDLANKMCELVLEEHCVIKEGIEIIKGVT